MAFWKPGNKQPSQSSPLPPPQEETQLGVESTVLSSPTVVDPKILSSSVMRMKFMKRKEDTPNQSADTESSAVKRRRSGGGGCDPIKSGNHATTRRLVCSREEDDPRTVEVPGRRSFGGFNKSVERHYQSVLDEMNFDKMAKKVENKTISDEEMLSRYENLIGLPRGPNQGRKQDQPRQSSKKK